MMNPEMAVCPHNGRQQRGWVYLLKAAAAALCLGVVSQADGGFIKKQVSVWRERHLIAPLTGEIKSITRWSEEQKGHVGRFRSNENM